MEQNKKEEAEQTCVVCKGKGIYYDEECIMCNGTGKFNRG